jgi:ribosome-binding protein aMBF1 (putative translation factor)
LRIPAFGGGIEPGVYSNREGGVVVILCDLCGGQKECLQKEIDGREFDICGDCWRQIEEKLEGKGRVKRRREMVFLPPRPAPEREPEEPKSPPGSPPKIVGKSERAN